MCGSRGLGSGTLVVDRRPANAPPLPRSINIMFSICMHSTTLRKHGHSRFCCRYDRSYADGGGIHVAELMSPSVAGNAPAISSIFSLTSRSRPTVNPRKPVSQNREVLRCQCPPHPQVSTYLRPRRPSQRVRRELLHINRLRTHPSAQVDLPCIPGERVEARQELVEQPIGRYRWIGGWGGQRRCGIGFGADCRGGEDALFVCALDGALEEACEWM